MQYGELTVWDVEKLENLVKIFPIEWARSVKKVFLDSN